MFWIIGGVALWSIVHLLKTVTPGFRKTVLKKLGEGGYKGLFSLAIVASFAMMIYGWRTGTQYTIYKMPTGTTLTLFAMFLIFLSMQLFVRTSFKSNTKRFIRNHQLTGIILFSAGHLLVNGDNLSLALFGGLGLWALIEIPLINRRDGKWKKPEKVSFDAEGIPTVVGIVVFAVLFFAHPWLSGMALL